jgi:hypothetical protein
MLVSTNCLALIQLIPGARRRPALPCQPRSPWRCRQRQTTSRGPPDGPAPGIDLCPALE